MRISYQGIGSGAGIKQFTAGLVHFGASDSAMSAKEIQEVPQWGVQLLPMTAGAVVLSYNVPDVPNRIKLGRKAYAGIFLGKITHWDDPSIVDANPGVHFPHLPITVIRRADGSGTTYVFTNHLAAISPEWKAGPGVGKSVSWPTGIGAKGNPGIAFTIDQTPGAIGYLEYSYTLHSGLKSAALQNKSGTFVEPSIESAAAALATAKLDENLVSWAPDPEGEESYPIVTYTWMLCRRVYDEPHVGQALKRMLLYSVTEGQKYSSDLGYVPLPDFVTARVKEAIEGIEARGEVQYASPGKAQAAGSKLERQVPIALLK